MEPEITGGRPVSPGANGNGTGATDAITRTREGLWEEQFFADLYVIGQLHHTYILCQAEDALILIDQHAAHERVLLEQLQHRASQTAKARQFLLMPETIDLGYREADVLHALVPGLQDFGLDIEPFGGNSFVVKAVPAFLAGREAKPLVLEIVEEAVSVDTGTPPGMEKAREQYLAVMACHGAIRANQSLDTQQIRSLLKQLDQCRNPSHCPHGRPTWIRWSSGFLEKAFRRTT